MSGENLKMSAVFLNGSKNMSKIIMYMYMHVNIFQGDTFCEMTGPRSTTVSHYFITTSH